MTSLIFEEIGNVINGFSTALGNAINSITSMFYTAPTGSATTGSLTVLGTLSLIAVGCGLVYWAFRLIKGLVRRA